MGNTDQYLKGIASLLDRLAANQAALADVVDRIAKPGGESSLQLSDVRGEVKQIRAALAALPTSQ